MQSFQTINYSELSADDKFQLFMRTLATSNRTPEYYVNWEKVERGVKKYEVGLNTLNYLVGKQDIYREALELFEDQPKLLELVPVLLATRDKYLDVLELADNDTMNFYSLDFENIDVTNVKAYVDFCEKSGLLAFLSRTVKKSLVDYVYGVEAGLDSNARKNRSGAMMEAILEKIVSDISNELGFEHKPQATAKFIQDKWGVHVPVDKSERRFDEAVYDPKTSRLWLFETNYYGGGGSKLKAVAGEFANLNNFIASSPDDVTFVWVTDGKGWNTARLPLNEAFGKIDNIYNLDMLNQGVLRSLFAKF
ncbi:type II restriction endonuclease [Canibacter oris]|uniref:Type-2 restriction enzyme n=1 Tax=Canibacter oris TaxID=1365628 RepID=A0A840DEA6_9MICO|nr:type II restriction endonuclease [Canibacter oris]MBB4071394.1 type II restriction enzyme [Canibacter oris]